MDLLILYSDSRKGSVVSLATLLHDHGISFHPLSLASAWDSLAAEDLFHYLKDNSHWLFLVDERELRSPAFLFAAGYAIASQERCFLLELERPFVPPSWKSQMQVATDFESLLELLLEERGRWEKFLSHLEAKSQLVELGLEISNTAFMEAVEKGDANACELFLRAGFSPNLIDKKGVTLLGTAVRAAHLVLVRLLLDQGADMNLKSRDRDNTPLMDAAAEGLTEIVHELLARGADVGGVSRNGQNSLVLAIGKGAEEIARLLLQAGADPFLSDKLGMNACQYAQLLGRNSFLEAVSARFPGQT